MDICDAATLYCDKFPGGLPIIGLPESKLDAAVALILAAVERGVPFARGEFLAALSVKPAPRGAVV